MAFATVGLSTHVWNNNLRCGIILALYPLILMAVVWGIAFVTSLGLSHNSYADRIDPTLQIHFANRIIFEFWPLIFSGVTIWFLIAWFFHSAMIRQLAHSRPVTRIEEPELYNILENLCISRGMKMPHLEIIETHARNAFASGIDEKSYAITVTRGLLNSLQKDELEAVLAHELTHIRNRDVRLLIVCIIFTGLFGFAMQLVWSNIRYSLFYAPRDRRNSNNKGSTVIIMLAIALLLWLGYIATLVMRFALSRRREYMADAGSVEITKNPDALMRALMRIATRDRIPGITEDIAMMCIENHVPFMGLFATHPPIEERIRMISAVTGAPVPTLPHAGPAEKEMRLEGGQKRENPWLIRNRRP